MEQARIEATGQAREAREAFARGRQRAWSCRGAGHERAPLTPDLALIETAAAETLGVECCGRCPFEGAYHPDDGGWSAELFDALALAGGERLPSGDEMGRPVTAVDRDGVLAIFHARGRMRALQDEQWKRERTKAQEARDAG